MKLKETLNLIQIPSVILLIISAYIISKLFKNICPLIEGGPDSQGRSHRHCDPPGPMDHPEHVAGYTYAEDAYAELGSGSGAYCGAYHS